MWKKLANIDKMSSFSPQKSFEKSLRSPSGSYQVPIIAPLKTEIHKGCTGKAHACGSIKSANALLANKSSATPKPKAKSDGKSLRKNSLSSETVSDSGSEISSSWNSNKDSSASSNAAIPPLLPKPFARTKSVNYGSNGLPAIARRRTSDSVISTDVPDNVRNGIRSGRLMSDGGDDKTVGEAVEASKLRRTSSFRLKNDPPMIPPKPKISQPGPAQIKRNGSFNNRLRNSFRSKTPLVTWNSLWESSFASKMGGGAMRILAKNILAKYDQVNKAIHYSNVMNHTTWLIVSSRLRHSEIYLRFKCRSAEVKQMNPSSSLRWLWFESTTKLVYWVGIFPSNVRMFI